MARISRSSWETEKGSQVRMDKVEVAVPAARVWRSLRNTAVRTLLGGILGGLLGGVLGALTCVAEQAGFSLSVAVRAGRLIDLEMGASMGVLPGSVGGLLIGLMGTRARSSVCAVMGTLLGSTVGWFFGVSLGDWLAHIHDSPVLVGSRDYYDSLVYFGLSGAVPGAIGGLSVALLLRAFSRWRPCSSVSPT
jgi:hypothetical protein